MITNLKEVKELDENIYVSMEYCNNETEKRDKEIERLNNELKLYKDNHEHLNNLLEQKENIIKEVRELLSKYNDNESNYYVPVDIALEILDKGE